MRILIVEEERMLARSMKSILEAKGFSVENLPDGSSGLRCALTGVYDLLILSITAPGSNGIQIVESVRKRHPMVPIILLATQSGTEDRIMYLSAGADYYLPKPFDFREMVACVDALLRRSGEQMVELVCGNTKLNLETCMLTCGQRNIRLSSREFNTMRFLMESQDKVVSKEKILARVWGQDSASMDNNLEVYVSLIRKKLERIGSNIRIVALRRLGYHLEIQ